MVDKKYCSSSFLMYRTIADHTKQFAEDIIPQFYGGGYGKEQIHDSFELEESLNNSVKDICSRKKTALALSGGIDSAILAKFMPKGSTAYTFKCIVPGIHVTDESVMAAKYAKECGLNHQVIEVFWEDFEAYAPILMKTKGAPMHSIEVQIYKAGIEALQNGEEAIIFGESSDLNYGGLSGLLSKDWTVGEFIDRYSYVKPYHVLKEFQMITEPITRYEKDGYVDVHEFDRDFFFIEAMGSYTNACQAAGIDLVTPYANTRMAIPLDLERIRRGENKYLVRELFGRLYPGFNAPAKIPMPRPMDEWFKDWEGPTRPEFWPNCVHGMTGDQKYYVWILEKFLSMIS
ncbi:MAG: asparagine synthase [Firmicutes bacterium]|nr:asparagine synthase [Bacillota bacterium]